MRKFVLIFFILCISILPACKGSEVAEQTSERVTRAEVQPVAQTPVPGQPVPELEETFVCAEMSDAQVFEMYAAAADKVKFYSAGFTRAFSRVCSQTVTADGSSALGDCMISYVEENGGIPGFFTQTVTAEHGDALSVNRLFPVYGEEKGCLPSAGTGVTDTSCGENGGYYNLCIYFSGLIKDNNAAAGVLALNTEPAVGEQFCTVLGPTAQTELYSLYYDCYLNCIIEKSTKRMVYLYQKLKAEDYIGIQTDMFAFVDCRAQLMCSYTDDITFYDFEWN